MNMNSDFTFGDIHIPANLICGCGEPMKINRDRGMPPIGCPRCLSEVCIDDPDEFDRVAELLQGYWLCHGRRDYAGLDFEQ
jgi:hypothetical protein